MTKLKHLVLGLASIALIAGCASGEKAELSSTEAASAARDIKEMKSDLEKDNVDLVAYKQYSEGVSDLNEALEDLKEGDDEQEILDSLAEAKAHFLKAKSTADNKIDKVSESIIDARSQAQMAGARATTTLDNKLQEIDDDLRDETDNFEDKLSVEELSQFQKRYLALEVKAVQNRQLGKFRAIIDRAESNDADDLAPNTLETAKKDLTIAENKIAQSPRDPAEYNKDVLESNKSAKLLDDVMNKLMGEAEGSPEKVALTLVYQERKLGKLSETVGNLQGNLAKTQSDLEATSKDLAEQRTEALSAQAQVRYQKAMDAVRKNFDDNEAEVYQQGDRLILRLKKLNFKTGSATIPTGSMDLLSKVEGIIKDIQPEKVQIQGHTDSTGSEKVNEKLSDARAKAVAKYLSSKGSDYDINSKGYGASQPLANNDTAKGRTLNRRVDIVIDAK